MKFYTIIVIGIMTSGCTGLQTQWSRSNADQAINQAIENVTQTLNDDDFDSLWERHLSPSYQKRWTVVATMGVHVDDSGNPTKSPTPKALFLDTMNEEKASLLRNLESAADAPRAYNGNFDRVRIFTQKPFNLQLIDGAWKLTP